MNHMHRIIGGVQVEAARKQLRAHPELWDQNTLRTTFENTPHKEVSDIWLRFNPLPTQGLEGVANAVRCIDYPAMGVLTEVRKLAMNIFAYVGGDELGRVLVTKLPPGGAIYPHRDMGEPAHYYERFHLCIQGLDAIYRTEDQCVIMHPGDLWYVDNQKEHEIINGPSMDRIHLIVDAHCRDWVESVYGAATGQESSKTPTLAASSSAAAPSST